MNRLIIRLLAAMMLLAGITAVEDEFFTVQKYLNWQKELEQRHEYEPENETILLNLAEISLYNEDLETAHQAVKKLRTLNSDDARYHLLEIKILRYLHRIGETLKSIDSFIEKHPGHEAVAYLKLRKPVIKASESLPAPLEYAGLKTREVVMPQKKISQYYPLMIDNIVFFNTPDTAIVYDNVRKKNLSTADIFQGWGGVPSEMDEISEWKNLEIFYEDNRENSEIKFPEVAVQTDDSIYLARLAPDPDEEGTENYVEFVDFEILLDKGCSFPAFSPWRDFLVTSCLVSDKPVQNYDLFVYLRTPEGWEPYESEGLKKLNTAFSEKSPVISMDGRFLHFTSNGHPSYSGYDIYTAEIEYKLPADEKVDRFSQYPVFKEVKNLHRSINSYHDEVYRFRAERKRKSLIYYSPKGTRSRLVVTEPTGLEPDYLPTVPVRFKVKSEDGSYIPGRLEVVPKANDHRKRLDERFYFESRVVHLHSGGYYTLSIRSPMHFYYFEKWRAPSGSSGLIEKKIKLKKIRPGASIAARGITFKTGSSKLTREAYDEIRSIRKLMADNPGISISVEGHTDSVGNAASNLQLSLGRAQAVREALTGMGVKKKRMRVRGFGSRRPVASNETAEGRSLNRRTEIRVMKDSGGESIAVVKFYNRTGKREYDWMQRTIASDTDSALADKVIFERIPESEVQVAVQSVAAKRGTTPDNLNFTEEVFEEIGQLTGATMVLTGHFEIAEDYQAEDASGIRIKAKLYNVKKDTMMLETSVVGPDNTAFLSKTEELSTEISKAF